MAKQRHLVAVQAEGSVSYISNTQTKGEGRNALLPVDRSRLLFYTWLWVWVCVVFCEMVVQSQKTNKSDRTSYPTHSFLGNLKIDRCDRVNVVGHQNLVKRGFTHNPSTSLERGLVGWFRMDPWPNVYLGNVAKKQKKV